MTAHSNPNLVTVGPQMTVPFPSLSPIKFTVVTSKALCEQAATITAKTNRGRELYCMSMDTSTRLKHDFMFSLSWSAGRGPDLSREQRKTAVSWNKNAGIWKK